MNDQLKTNKNTPVDGYDMEKDELNIEQYIQPRRYQSKFWTWLILGVIFVLLAVVYKVWILDNVIPPDEVAAMMKVFDINSHWVEGEKIDTPDFKGILLVPEISFRVRNIGKRNLHYVNILGVFWLLNKPDSLGQSMFTAFRDPVRPGGESGTIRLRCEHGYRATSKKAFAQNKKDWLSTRVKILVKCGTSTYADLAEYFISRRIDGIPLEIKVIDAPASQINQMLDDGKKQEKKNSENPENQENKENQEKQ